MDNKEQLRLRADEFVANFEKSYFSDEGVFLIDRLDDSKAYKIIRRARKLFAQSKDKRLLAVRAKAELAFMKHVAKNRGKYWGMGVDFDKLMEAKDPNASVQPVIQDWADSINHTGVEGTTRVGKSYMMAGDIYQGTFAGHNEVIIDPKPGADDPVLKVITDAAMMTDRMDEVEVIAPASPDMNTIFFNPYFGMSNEEISSFNGMLIAPGDSSDDVFYRGIAQEITRAICFSFDYLQAETDPDKSYTQSMIEKEMEKHHNINRYKSTKKVKLDVNHIGDPHLLERMKNTAKSHKRPNKEIQFSRELIGIDEFAYYSDLENLSMLRDEVEDTGQWGNNRSELERLKSKAMEAIDKVLNTDPAFYSKVSKRTANIFAEINTGPIGDIFGTVRVNPLTNRFLDKDKGIILLIEPAPMKFATVSSMFVRSFIKSVESLIGNMSAGGMEPPRRTNIRIDEAGAVMYPSIENLYNKGAAFGFTFYNYTQSSADYTLSLGDNCTNVLMDNVNTKARMKTNDGNSKQKAVDDFGTVRKMQVAAMAEETTYRSSYMMGDEAVSTPDHFQNMGVGRAALRFLDKRYLVDLPFIELPEIELERDSSHFQKSQETFKAMERKVSFEHKEAIDEIQLYQEFKKSQEEIS